MASDGFKEATSGESGRLNVVVYDQNTQGYMIDEIAMTPELRSRIIESGYLGGSLMMPDKLEAAGIEIDPDRTYLAYDVVSDAIMGLYNNDLKSVIDRAELIRMEAQNEDAQKTFHDNVDVGDPTLSSRADGAVELIEYAVSEYGADDVAGNEVDGLISDLRDMQGLVGKVQEMLNGYDRAPHLGDVRAERTEPDYEQFKPEIVAEPEIVLMLPTPDQ